MMNDSPAPQEIFLLKLGEVVLKGLNRQSFEDKLLANVRRRVKNCGSFQCSLRQSTIYVEPQSGDCDMEAAWTACRQVFGIAAVARAVPCEKTVPAIVEAARTYLADAFAAAKSFKVESKRADKTYPMNSIQLSQAVGGDLAELFPNVAVDVHHPDLTVFVEIREKYAYVHTPSIPGAGGLPIGMGGRAVSLLSGGIDSPVSSWMMARRGVELEMVHFVSPPYTSQQAQDKVLELARLLTAWTRPAAGAHRPLHENSGGDPEKLPGGVLHPHHAPVHDAHCGGHRQKGQRRGPGHRRVPGPGGQPDHAGPGGHGGRDLPAGAAAPDRHGQGGDHPDVPGDRGV